MAAHAFRAASAAAATTAASGSGSGVAAAVGSASHHAAAASFTRSHTLAFTPPASATSVGSSPLIRHALGHGSTMTLTLPAFGRVVVNWHWVLGVSLAVAAQFVSNLGLNLQRLSHMENAALPEGKRVRMTLRPKWVLGMVLIGAGSLGDLAALTFAAQSLVATLGSLTMVSNVLFAPLLLGERLTRAHLSATALVLLGCTLVVAFGPHESEIYHIDALMHLYVSSTFFAYAVVVTGVCAAIYTSIQWIEREYLVSSNPLEYHYPHVIRQYHRTSYAALSGIVGAQSVLLGKGFAEMVKTTFAGRGVMFGHMMAYIIIPAMVASVVLQIRWLNSGIKRFGLLYVVPIFQTFWTVVSVIGGLVVYNEWREFTPQQGLVFVAGISLTLYGVSQLARAPIGKGRLPKSQGHRPSHGSPFSEAEPFLGDTMEPSGQPTAPSSAAHPDVWMGNSGPWAVQSARDATAADSTFTAGGPAGVLSQINQHDMLGELDVF